jgi:hypothetical protein
MSFHTERLQCPKHFQERMNQVGGFNRYGQPNFRIAWAQTETTRQGGQWEAEGEQFVGYRDVPLGDGLPHWMLLRWIDAGKSLEMPFLPRQSADNFYEATRCPNTGLQLLGGYPFQGSYKIVLNLVAKWFEGNELKVEPFPLSTEIINMMIPVIEGAQLISMDVKRRLMDEEREEKERVFATQIEDISRDIAIPEHAHESQWVQDKVRSLERAFNAGLVRKFARNQGISISQRGR